MVHGPLRRWVLRAHERGAESPASPSTKPALSIKRSVRPDHIAFVEGGKHFSMLRRHLMTDHKLTPEQYPVLTLPDYWATEANSSKSHRQIPAERKHSMKRLLK
jgi:predicted transcriptional regulator